MVYDCHEWRREACGEEDLAETCRQVFALTNTPTNLNTIIGPTDQPVKQPAHLRYALHEVRSKSFLIRSHVKFVYDVCHSAKRTEDYHHNK